MTATRRLSYAEQVMAFADEVTASSIQAFSVKLGVRQAFSAATTFNSTIKTPKLHIRDQ